MGVPVNFTFWICGDLLPLFFEGSTRDCTSRPMILTVIFLFVVLLLGAPLFSIIAASAMLGFYRSEIDLSVMAIEFFGLSEMPILVAIPLFTFAGFILS